MQPYVFPYIGYMQLVHASDVFVFYDDVNFINRGWINRNRILSNGKDLLFTIPLKEASQNKLIKDIEVADDGKTIQKTLTTIAMCYKKAPYFNDVYGIVERTLTYKPGMSIGDMAINSVLFAAEYLGLKRTFKNSSSSYTNQELKRADRLIDICHIEGIDHYINAAGGKEIYTKEYYAASNVKLDFLMSDKQEYEQFKHPHVPWLSIIDVMMFNSVDEIMTKVLPSYHLE
jgi:hypothetical protein